MKKAVIGIVLVLVIGIMIFVFGHEKTSDVNTEKSTNPPTPTTNTSTTQQTNSNDTTEVEIEDFAFQPTSITIKVGQKVTWTNKDSVAHNVIFDDSKITDSGTLNKDDSYTLSFDSAGTFTYICSFHPNMKGTVVVTE